MSKKYKWIFAVLTLAIIAGFGFTFTVKEGSSVIVSRFGEVRSVQEETGLHFKLPWPFEKLIPYDTRNQYMDSGLVETLTNDKKNIILQTYVVWSINDPLKFYTSIGTNELAEKYIGDLVANVKNGVMGNYELSALVSTAEAGVKIEEISKKMETKVASKAGEDYGVDIVALKIKRIALPNANVTSVLEQMVADRQKYITQLTSEGERDAAIIMSEADAQAAEIIAAGQLSAAAIDAETERMVATIYSSAYKKNPTLFAFLKKLIALEKSVSEDTVLIMRGDEGPYQVIYDMD